MKNYQRAWQLIQPQIVPYFVYFLVCVLVSGFTFQIPLLNVFRELRNAVNEGRVPDVKKALDIEVIKNDIVMWAVLLGTSFAIYLVVGMCVVPFVFLAVILGGISEILLALMFLVIFGVALVVAFVAILLFFWVPWIYIEENLDPFDNIKASFYYGKAHILPTFIHVIVFQVSVVLSSLFCYLPGFLALAVGFVATVYLVADHREGIQKVIQDHNLAPKQTTGR